MVYGSCLGEMRKTQKILVGKRDEKRWFGRCLYRWEDNIKLYLKNKI
jgi:hypothetical protein